MRYVDVRLLVMTVMLAGTLPAWSDTPPANPPQASAEEAAKKAKLDRAVEKEAQNYSVRKKDGQEMYCRRETELDSHIAKMICLTRAQLVDRVVSGKLTQDKLHE